MLENKAIENCVFCQILKGELPGSMIHEDDNIAVFVDLYPINEGHLLIIPKYHAPYMKDVDTVTLQHMMVMAAKLNAALRQSGYQCEGVNLIAADGAAANQEVLHFHLHVIPRFKGDGFEFKHDNQRNFRRSERDRMNDIATTLKKQLQTILINNDFE